MKRTQSQPDKKWSWNYEKGRHFGFPEMPEAFKIALKDTSFYNYFFSCYINFIENDFPQLQCVVPSWLESRLGGRFKLVREGDQVKVVDDKQIAMEWIQKDPALSKLVDSLDLKVENVQYGISSCSIRHRPFQQRKGSS